jgi:hypothetical protein
LSLGDSPPIFTHEELKKAAFQSRVDPQNTKDEPVREIHHNFVSQSISVVATNVAAARHLLFFCLRSKIIGCVLEKRKKYIEERK